MPTDLENVFYNNSSVEVGVGATIEYNMNNMIDNISVVNTSTSYEELYTKVEGKNAYKKLFPLDSIIKPFRPLDSGIKYYLFLNNEHAAFPFDSTRKIDYPSTKPRIYYAGLDNFYKYWVSAENKNMDVTLKYVQSTAVVTEAYSTGTEIVYTTQQSHGFTSGQTFSITGLSTSAFNLSGATISSVPTTNTFTVTSTTTGARVVSATATATLSQATKTALANKIIVRFEKYHALPSSCVITVTKSDGTTTSTTVSSPSEQITLHYHGTTPSWQTSIAEPKTYADPIAIKSIRVTAVNPGGNNGPSGSGTGRVIGLIEISARWVKDISSDIVDMSIQKESSSTSEDILPVGKVTSNSLVLNLAKYINSSGSQASQQIVEYNTSDVFDSTLIYMKKNAEIRPYFKVYHTGATTVAGSYDKVYEGVYYVDNFSISDYGDTSVTCLDSAKYLMETIAPERVYEEYSVVSIIRSMLDSVGFSSYNFNYNTASNKINDDSIPQIKYWWSDGTSTIWDCIQELCQDIQMNALVDNNGVLQFYSRNYIYNTSRGVGWEFYYEKSGSKLANIMSFNKKEIAAANQVKIIWSVPVTSDLVGGSQYLWTSPSYYLTAGAVTNEITTSSPWVGGTLELKVNQLNAYSNLQTPFGFNGYFLIDSEIIEYDAIRYQYESSITNNIEEDWVTSDLDLAKIKNLAKGTIDYESVTNSFNATFKPLPKYRVKKRGALGTTVSSHKPSSDSLTSGVWTAYGVAWDK